MSENRICKLFGIQYPIVQAAMAWVSVGELAAAVSNAGGLGTIGPNVGLSGPSYDANVIGDKLREQIRKAKSLTSKPFAVNFPVGRVGKDACDRRVEIGIEEGVRVAVVSLGSPEEYTKRLKGAGMKVIHAVSSPEQAQKAEAAGVDAVVVEGYDGAGHSGFDKLSTFALVPTVVDSVKIPVLAAGGIVEARGFVAALALGAEGIYMGTRFLVSKECGTHPAVKAAIVQATGACTVSFNQGPGRGMSRLLKNDFTKECEELIAKNPSQEDLTKFLMRYTDSAGNKTHRPTLAFLHGDVQHGSISCGVGAPLIKAELSAAEIIQQIVRESETVMRRLERTLVLPTAAR